MLKTIAKAVQKRLLSDDSQSRPTEVGAKELRATAVGRRREKEIVKQVSKALRREDPDDFTFRITTDKGVKLIEHPLFFKDGFYKTKKDITITMNQDCYIKKLEVQITLMDEYKKWLDIPITKTQYIAGGDLIFSFKDNSVVSYT